MHARAKVIICVYRFRERRNSRKRIRKIAIVIRRKLMIVRRNRLGFGMIGRMSMRREQVIEEQDECET